MGKKKDSKQREEMSDADLQEMLDNNEIFSSEDTDFSTNYEAYEMGRQLAGEVRDCDCGRTDPHVHLSMERPEGLDMSEEDLGAFMQKKFNEEVQKAIREKEKAAKKRELGLG